MFEQLAFRLEFEKNNKSFIILRAHSKSLDRKLARELSEVKSSFSNVLKERERERKARLLLEDLCDEFSKGMIDYEQEIRVPKHKFEKDLWVGEHTDRLILHISGKWLDEWMQMELAESGFGLQDKKAILDEDFGTRMLLIFPWLILSPRRLMFYYSIAWIFRRRMIEEASMLNQMVINMLHSFLNPHRSHGSISALFFLLDNLKLGKVMPIYFPDRDPSLSHFTPREEADAITFSSKHLLDLLRLFSFSQGSPQATTMADTLQQCEMKQFGMKLVESGSN